MNPSNFIRSHKMFIFFVYSFITIISIHWTAAATDYCKISSCAKGKQTMCLYSSATPSNRCTNYVSDPFTSADKAALVNKHNQLREYVANGHETRGNPGPQPSASNMKAMKWDDELARVAQRYADQCLSGHDECRNVERFSVGQNIVTVWSTGQLNQSLASLVDVWYGEVKYFSSKNLSPYRFNSSYGHYSQLLWADTSLIGCGRVRYWDTGMKMNCLRLICNYATAGNYIGLSMYKTGAPASTCSSGVSKTSSSLCN